MKYEEFIKRIQDAGDIKDFGVAERAASAVLEVLGENLTNDEAAGISQQLPTHIRYALVENNKSDCFDLSEFIQRVVDREETTFEEAEAHVRTVLPLLREVIDRHSFQELLSILPGDVKSVLQSSEVTKSSKRFVK